ncbi:MAG: alpha-L-fucosidase [Calditrichaeota bacterium]|nr:alpha-L-fucosidase [Calditrichota bacterium]
MKSWWFFLLPLILVVATGFSQEKPVPESQRMQWFEDAKLGIFIHWGIYAVDGIAESWSFHNGQISYEDYMKQLSGFTASHYDPDAWARLFKESGARYAVLTSKHHDGVALWPTKLSHLNVVEKTPAGRDLIGPYCKALRKNGLKVGLYFSILDWSYPDYPHFTNKKDRYDANEDTARWNRFVKFYQGQIEEICTRYKPDLLWFDGDWEFPAKKLHAREIREKINHWLPNVIVNSRLQGYGDYATPEQGVPITRPKAHWWELCMTINDSWGYQPKDQNYKSVNEIIRIFVDCISMGGNLLLDVGAKPDGTFPEKQVQVLKELGRWTHKHAEAIYGTRAGIPKDYFYGPSALSKDKKTLYLFLTCNPNGPVLLKGLKNKITQIRVVGNGTELKWKVMMKLSWSPVPGIVAISVPKNVLDKEVTVLAIHLKEPIDLFEDTN